MNSLEWRLKKLEDKVLGNNGQRATSDIDHSSDQQQQSIYDQLDSVAKHFKNFVDNECTNYQRFVDLYDKHVNNPIDVEGESSKAELVLAYEDELTEYLNKTKQMTEQAERVLNIDKWADLTGCDQRIDRLQTITQDQVQQAQYLDKKTEGLIDVYNDIIGSFKRNMITWDQKLEAHENQETPPEDDV